VGIAILHQRFRVAFLAYEVVDSALARMPVPTTNEKKAREQRQFHLPQDSERYGACELSVPMDFHL